MGEQDDDGAFYQPWQDPERDYAAGVPPTSHSGPAGEVEKVVLGAGRFVDRAQARFTPVAFGYAVFKKYADDEGSRLAAMLAYYFFLSIFPLAIGGYAVLRTVAENNPDAVNNLVEQVVPPEYQQQIIDSYATLPSGGAAFWVALIGLLIAGTGGAFALYAMINQVFCVPYRFRFGFGPRYLRVLLVVLMLGVAVLVIAGFSVFAGRFIPTGAQQPLSALVGLLVAFAVLFAAPKVLARRTIRTPEIVVGAMIGAVAITVIVSLAGVITARFLNNSSAVYGAMTTVVAFISVLFLVSNAVVLSYEISVVRAWRLWPRGVDINVLFPADERAYTLLTQMDERMPSQRNGTYFDASGHDDPRRPDLEALMRRPEGVPRTPYEGESEDVAGA
ncbi:MAG: YihY/virulence factor BrkB family protein [Candidatus Nanopelagicales bacterium]|nr:YihY/virulence factor BrkB family protein [Candidatus Nanopelagicales bacterium]